MPILITGLFAPSGGAGSFDLYAPEDIQAGDVNVVLQAIAGGSFKGGAHATAPAGEVVAQVKTTTGAPSHSASLGTLCWNSIDLILYVNNNGSTGWTAIGSGSGTVGPMGPPGVAGEEGEPGPVGPPGPAGTTGATGAAGAAGAMGPPGWEGEEGPPGPPIPGPTGAVGATGPAGVSGPPGYEGEQGEPGPSIPGPIGATGETGATGSAGAAGPAGATGAVGPPGEDGEPGLDGFPGPVGPTGATGAAGSAGAAGAAGMMGPPGQDGEDGEPGWPIPGPAGAGGGHAIEDEGVPVTVRANLDIIGENAQAVDDGTDTELRIGGRLYDAIVNTAANEGGVTPNTYATLALAIASGAESIFVRSDISAEADVTIAAGAGVLRITGRGPGCSYLPNIHCDKAYLIIDNCSLKDVGGAPRTITFDALGCVAFSLYVTGTAVGNRIVFTATAYNGTVIRCGFVSTITPISIATTGVDVTGCTFYSVQGAYCIYLQTTDCSVVGCKFTTLTVSTGAIYGLDAADRIAVNGCIFSGSFTSIYCSNGCETWNISGNLFSNELAYVSVRLGGASVLSGNAFSSLYTEAALQPVIQIGLGLNVITGNEIYYLANFPHTGIATAGTSPRPNLIASNLFYFQGSGSGQIGIDLSNSAQSVFQMITGNCFLVFTSAIVTSVTGQSDRTLIYNNTYLGYTTPVDRGMQLVRAYNNSGGALDWGRIVIDQGASGREYITTTTTPASPLVRGVIATTGYPAAGWATARWSLIAIGGVYPVLCDTVAVAIGDFLGTSATAGWATKQTPNGTGTTIGMALEAKAASATPITFRAAASASAGSDTLTLTINKPAGTVENDIMIASIAICPNTPTITAPTGWTLIRRTNNANANAHSLASYYRVAGASEGASYAWTFDASSGSAGGISSFYNGETTAVVDVESGANTASALTHAAPTVTTVWANSMIVTAHAMSSSETWTTPAGMTEAFDAASAAVPGAAGVCIEGSYVIQAAAGASGTKTATASGNADVGNTHTIAIRTKVYVLCQIGKL